MNEYLQYLEEKTKGLITTYYELKEQERESAKNLTLTAYYNTLASGIWDRIDDLKKCKEMYLKTHKTA